MASSSLFSRQAYPYDNERLLVDVANSAYALHGQLTPRSVRALWASLCAYIHTSILQHKVSHMR